MVVLPVLFLLGSLFLCGRGQGTYSTEIERLKMAALEWKGPQTCNKWDCNCTFYRQRGCCCAANEMFALEEETFERITDLWHHIAKLVYRVHELTEYSQIAFKASMDGSILDQDSCFGPSNYKMTIPYTNITLNDGSGYKASMGVFTAPCGGVYVFSLTVYSSVKENGSLYHKVQLMKNGIGVVGVWEQNREDHEDNANQVVVLEMQRGDQVYVELLNGRKICTTTAHSINNNIFTGYILYTHTFEDDDSEDSYE